MNRNSIQVIVPSYNLEQVSYFLSNYETIDYSFIFVLPSSELITNHNSQHIFINQSGTGIYNAINDGIKKSKCKFYLVCGCDDYIDLNALSSIGVNSLNDVNVFPVSINNKLHYPQRYIFTDAHKSFISEHSVGTIFRSKLHELYGFYDEKFTVASDAKYILLLKSRSVAFKYFNIPLGKYSICGTSSRCYVLGQTELLKSMFRYFPFISLFFTLFYIYRISRKFLQN